MKRRASLALGDEALGEASKRLATQLQQLKLSDSVDHTFDEAGYMQDVQARGFEVVDSLTVDDPPEIEIAPSFLKIPRAIIDESAKPFYERASNALIPYTPPTDSSDKSEKYDDSAERMVD